MAIVKLSQKNELISHSAYLLLAFGFSNNLKNIEMAKTFLQITEYKEIDIEFPFYAYVQEENAEIYVKIDEIHFSEIIFHDTGKVEFIKFKNHNNIGNIWYQNKTTDKVWKTALADLKNSMYRFLS